LSNRAPVLHAPLANRLEERPLPHVGPREMLVALKAVGVCGSDVHYYEHGRIEVKSLVTNRFSLEQAEQALQATKRDPANLKSMIILDDEKE
jgi:threonine dehydrogenase-like Zn-dependent dehydrogenase